MDPLQILCLAVGGFSIGTYLLMMAVFAVSLGRSGPGPSGSAPPTERVSILKPLSGWDDDLADNLASFAALRGVHFELLLGVASPADPAWPLAADFVRSHPELEVRLVQTDPDAALNPKVAQLLGLERVATGEVLVISDSNVRVRPDYLVHLLIALRVPGVGLVSSLIAGTGERSLGAALENLVLATHVAPGVVGGYALSRNPITIGKSMAMRRADLRALGGFAAVADVLAEDHALGRLFAGAGHRVSISKHRVDNRNVACSMRRSLERHTRWAKIRRAMAPAGFPFEPLLMPLPITAAGVLLAPCRETALLLAVAVALHVLGAQLALTLLRGRPLAWHLLPLELVRPPLLLACWGVAWCSRRVRWRGHVLSVGAGTALAPAQPGMLDRVLSLVRG